MAQIKSELQSQHALHPIRTLSAAPVPGAGHRPIERSPPWRCCEERRKHYLTAYALIAPFVLIFVLVFLYPAIRVVG